MVEQSIPTREHPDADVRVAKVVKAAGVLLLIIALCIAAVFGLHAWRGNGAASNFGPNVRGAALNKFSLPRLQAQPTVEREQYFKEKHALLNEYGWVDRKQGIVRIPIEQAMRELAAQGEEVRR